LYGEPLTVRAEVYALGATLADALARRGSTLGDEARLGLTKIAARATEKSPTVRYPSVDELTSAMRRVAGLGTSVIGQRAHKDDAAWPVLGLEASSSRLASAVARIMPGEALAIEGPPGSGRTTLARRLAWTLGVEGRAVATIDVPGGDMTAREVVDLELNAWRENKAATLVIVVDDLYALDADARAAIALAAAKGARVVAIGEKEDVAKLAKGTVYSFEVPALDPLSADELVRRAVPSLPEALRKHLVERVEGRPGKLRAFIRKIGKQAIVSEEDIDAVVSAPSSHASLPPPMSRDETFVWIERALDLGRFAEAAAALVDIEPTVINSVDAPLTATTLQTAVGRRADSTPALPSTMVGRRADSTPALPSTTVAPEAVRIAILRARIALGRGDASEALVVLDATASAAKKSAFKRAWQVQRARAALRTGDYAAAGEVAERVVEAKGGDALAAEALAIRGMALAYTDDPSARAVLEQAVATAKACGDRRAEGIAFGSLAIAHQRAGRAKEAREAYEASLAAAEGARDASTVAVARLNLASLAQVEGDIALALTHLEAAVDMGRRAGGLVAVQQALLNLASLDLYLGRYARAAGSIESLAKQRDSLGPLARAQLLGLEAEHAARTGDSQRASRLYELCAKAYDGLDRPLEAAEVRLEAILTRTREAGANAGALASEFDEVRARLGEGGFREHEALAGIVRGQVALLAGNEAGARTALDNALEQAQKAGRKEWAWRALDARARLASSQGSNALARRDTETALAMLEETASKLPRDLREVFWDDPRRRALRQATAATIIAPSAPVTMNIPSTRRVGIHSTHTALGPMPAEDRLARIFEITREIASEHDLGRLLAKVTDHAIALVGAERGFVVLANDAGELEAHAARDRKGDEPHARFSRSVAEKVVATGEPVIATSARDDARLAQAVSVHQLMIQSIACVPIHGLAHGQGTPPTPRAVHSTIGALYLETRLRPGVRFNDELPTLMAFANQAAIAIESARLLDENSKRAEELAQANRELSVAKKKVEELLSHRTEQLTAVRRDLKQARAELRSHFGYGGLVGTSASMRRLYAVIDRIKDTDVPVLITGESGVGKEIVAKAIHASGARAKEAFLGVNCGAIPANLLESELFGHVRGAFTGAERDRKGLFREADNGTILLDEIGEMPTKMQASLLRALQEKTVRPIGGAKEEPTNARVIAATNRDLMQMVQAGAFREDLYYRLHVIELHVPALRDRREDIPPLIDYFLTLFAARHRRDRKSVSRDALRRMCAFDWPGNVRHLEHVLLNAWLMSDRDEIELEDLELPEAGRAISDVHHRGDAFGAPGHRGDAFGAPGHRGDAFGAPGHRGDAFGAPGHRGVPSGAPATGTSAPPPPNVAKVANTKEEFKDTERERILTALTSCNWNRVQAAKMIGIPRRTFYRRLKEYGIV
jgi:transcriptional regulator with GAF, ATPase, and Fis domain